MSDLLHISCAVLVAFLILVLPYIAAQWIVRGFAGSPHPPNSRARLTCPNCGSRELIRSEANRVTPFPGHSCRGCDLRMRSPGSTAFYVVVLVLSVVLIVLFTFPIWFGGDGGIAVFPFMLVVAGYSVYQLFRPTPRESRSSSDQF